MRLVHVVAFYLPSLGGIQYYVRNLSQALTQRSHHNDILTVNTEDVARCEERPEATVYRCALDFNYHRGLISRELVSRLFSHGAYDIVHVHIPFPFGLEVAALAATRKGAPLVVTHHGTGPKDDRLYMLIAGAYDRLYRNLSLRGADRSVFLTESYRDALSLPPAVRARSRVVRTGADVETFRPDVDGRPVRERYGLSGEDVVGLWVGSLSEHNRYKGVNYLLDAMAGAAASGLKLLVVGGGPLLGELRAQTARLGIAGRVRFAGPVENGALPAYYAAADFLVLPSLHGPENSPVVVFEAMASGKPVVASDIPGVREVVLNGQTGLLLPPRDVTALTAALATLVVDDGLRRVLGRNARARAVEHSWHHCAAQMEQVYDEALAQRATAGAPGTHSPRKGVRWGW